MRTEPVLCPCCETVIGLVLLDVATRDRPRKQETAPLVSGSTSSGVIGSRMGLWQKLGDFYEDTRHRVARAVYVCVRDLNESDDAVSEAYARARTLGGTR